MMLQFLNENESANLLEEAVIWTMGKMESMAAGKMGMSTSEVGDTIVKYIKDKSK